MSSFVHEARHFHQTSLIADSGLAPESFATKVPGSRVSKSEFVPGLTLSGRTLVRQRRNAKTGVGFTPTRSPRAFVLVPENGRIVPISHTPIDETTNHEQTITWRT